MLQRALVRFLTLIAACALPAQAQGPFEQAALPGFDSPVAVSIVPSSESVAPGGQGALAIVLDQAPGWHVQTNDPPRLQSFNPIPTSLDRLAAENATLGPTQWPQSEVVEVNFTGTPIPFPVLSGQAIIYVPFTVPADATGQVRITFDLTYQACNDVVCNPPVTLPEEIVLPIGEAAAVDWPPEFAGLDRATFSEQWGTANQAAPREEGQEASGGSSFFGFVVPRGLAALCAFAIIGGLILNLTPCVLPVIPLKVMAISRHAGTPGRSLVLGLWMALGVVGFWLGIGLPVAFLTSVTDPSQLFGIWWVTLGIGVIIAIMGVGIMGLFEIKLPDAVYRVNPRADSAAGSFFFGIMTAVLGLPCFGFIAGGLLAGAATMPPVQVLAIFTSIGVGMALPYFVLAVRPKWVEFIPRTGPASDLVKQVMGLLMLAAAAFFVGSGIMALVKADPVRAAGLPVWAKVADWWMIALFVTAAGVWLIYRTFRITRKSVGRGAFTVIGLIMAAASVIFAVDRTDDAMHDIWNPFTEQVLAGSLERGDVVVIDFTADWCLNCQALKAGVLDREPVKSRLASARVVPLIADLTSQQAPGWDKLRSLGQKGIPLLAIYGPGTDGPWLSNAYTPAQVLEAISQASGEADAERSAAGAG